MEGRPATNGGNNLSTVSVRVEKAHEIVETARGSSEVLSRRLFLFCGHRRVRRIGRDWHHPQRLGLHARVGRFEPSRHRGYPLVVVPRERDESVCGCGPGTAWRKMSATPAKLFETRRQGRLTHSKAVFPGAEFRRA